MNSSSSSNRSVSVHGPGSGWAVSALGIVFIVLKLTGVITWSWWLVLLPFLVQLVAGAVGLVVMIVAATVLYRKRNDIFPFRGRC